MSKLRLMIPGPVEVDDDVLAAIGEPTLPHYGPAWMPTYQAAMDLLKRLFETEYDVLLIPGPGSCALEMAIASLVPAGTGLCVPSNGFFGQRLTQIAEANDLRVWPLDFPMGTHVDPDALRNKLKAWIPQAEAEGQPIKALAMVHHETSTGVLNPLQEVALVAQEFDLPTIIDAIASFGGVRIPVDEWGIDACVSVPNKCLAVPPGVAIMSVSKRAWELATANPGKPGWYLDLRTWAWYRENWSSWHPYPTTMPTNNIVALHKALENIFAMGVDAYFERFIQAAGRTREALGKMGFALLPEPAYAAPVVSTLKTRPDLDIGDMLGYLLSEHGLMVSGGLGDLHGQVFRVGHMGRANSPEYTEAFIEAVRSYLEAKGLDL